MAFSIVPASGLVTVDGVTYTGLSFQIDPTIHAAHEKDGRITVEFNQVHLLGQEEPTRPLNVVITDTAPFQFALAAWKIADLNAKALKDKQMADEDALRLAAEQNAKAAEGGA